MTDMFKMMRDAQVSDKRINRARTENGAVVYKTTGKEIVDLNFVVTGLRSLSGSDMEEKMSLAYYENPVLFCKWLFYLRDCREGLGEKHSFKEMFKILISYNEDYAVKLVPFIPTYGYWKDVFDLLHCGSTRVENTVKELLITQFKEDLEVVFNQDKPEYKGRSISLLGKWMPSINAGKKARREASYICRNVFHVTFETYRKAHSKLREYLKVVERDMCAREFGNINYSEVPAVAGLKYKNAFKKHDEVRYNEYINRVNNGEAKINASVLFPHDVYVKYSPALNGWYGRNCSDKLDPAIEAYWKALPNMVKEGESTMVVCDGSGSMQRGIDGNVMAIEVARALGIYFSEHLTGPYKDKVIEFSAYPKFIDLTNCKTLWAKRQVMERYTDCSNTNIEAVFDLILTTAINNQLSQEDLPKNILIISDMQFDSHQFNYNEHLFDAISRKFEARGYKLPKLIFWNLCGQSRNTIPVIENDYGVALVSGFSTNIAKMVCNGEADPYISLCKVLNTERYAPIEEALTGQIA